MEPLPPHPSLSEGRTRTYLDSGLSPTRSSINGLNASIISQDASTTAHNTSAINASSTTFSSPIYGATTDNARPPHPSQSPGQGSRNIRALVSTLRETSILLGEPPAALTAMERRRQRELGAIDEHLPKGSYINGHYAVYDNETPTLMGNAATVAIAGAASTVGVSGGAADFLDGDEDDNGNIARDEDRELPYSFLSATGLPEELESPDPTRVTPQLIKDIITHTAARQRLHLRLFYENLQDFLSYDDTTNAEWEMLLATLFVLARRRGGLTVLQRRYHEEVSELSFDILFVLLGTPEENPKFPQVLTALNALMRRLGCKKETDLLEQFFIRPDPTGEEEAAKNAHQLEGEEGIDSLHNENASALRLRQVDDVFPRWETDDDVDEDADGTERNEITVETPSSSPAPPPGGEAAIADDGVMDAHVAEIPAQPAASNPTLAGQNIQGEIESQQQQQQKEPDALEQAMAEDIRVYSEAAKSLPSHPFYYSLDSLSDPVDRGDLTEDEFLLIESWFRSLPVSVTLTGVDEGGDLVAADTAPISLVDTLRLVGAAMMRAQQSSTFTHSRGDLFVGRGFLGSRYISDKTLRNFQAQFAGVINAAGKRLPGGTCSFFQLMNFLFPTCPEKTLLRRCQMVVLSDHILTVDKILHFEGRIQAFLREQHVQALMSSLSISREVALEKLAAAAINESNIVKTAVHSAPQPQPAAAPIIANPTISVGRRGSAVSRGGSRPPTPSQRRPSVSPVAARRGSSAVRRPSASPTSPAIAPAAPIPVTPTIVPSSLVPPLVLTLEATATLKSLLVEERARFLAGHQPQVTQHVEQPHNANEVSSQSPDNQDRPPVASTKRLISRPMTPVGTTTNTSTQLAALVVAPLSVVDVGAPAPSPTIQNNSNRGNSPSKRSPQLSPLSPVAPSVGLGAVSVPAPSGRSNNNNDLSPASRKKQQDDDEGKASGPQLPAALRLVSQIAPGHSHWNVVRRLQLLQRTDWGSGALSTELAVIEGKRNPTAAAIDADEHRKTLSEEYAIGLPIKLKSPADRTTAKDLFPSDNTLLLRPVGLTVSLAVALLEWFHQLDWAHSGAVSVKQLVDLAETQRLFRQQAGDHNPTAFQSNTSTVNQGVDEGGHAIYCGDWRIDLDELLEYKQGSVTFKHHQDRVTQKAPTQHGNLIASGHWKNSTNHSQQHNSSLHNVTLGGAEAEAVVKRREVQIRHLPPTLVFTFEDIMRYLFLDLENPPAPLKGPLGNLRVSASAAASRDGDGQQQGGGVGEEHPPQGQDDPLLVRPSTASFADILHQPFLRSRLDEFTSTVKEATEIYIANRNALIESTIARNEGYKVELQSFVAGMNDKSVLAADLQKKVGSVVDRYAQRAKNSSSQTLAATPSSIPLTSASVPSAVALLLVDVVNTNPAGDVDTALPYTIYVPKAQSISLTAENPSPSTFAEDTAASSPPELQCTTTPSVLQFAATHRTTLMQKRTLTTRHQLVKQYKNGRRRELVAEAMRSQFDFIQKSLQEHVPREVGPFLKMPPVYMDLFGLSINDTIFDLSYFASRQERRLQVRELLVTLDQSGIPARFFIKDQRLHATVPIPSGLSGASSVYGSAGIYGVGGEFTFCGPIHVYRDFAFCSQRPAQGKHLPTGVLQSIQIVTNIPVKSGVKFRLHLEGYNFGVNRPINTIVVGSADKRFESVGTLEYFGWPDRWDQDTILNKGNGLENASIYVSEAGKGFVCVELQAKSFMHVGFGVSAWLLQHGHGGKHALAVKFVHSAQRL